MNEPIGMAEMNQVFDVVDELEISRESIQVPLLPEGAGAIRRTASGKIEITLPATRALEEFLGEIRTELAAMGREEESA